MGANYRHFHRLDFLFLATGILHTFLAWSKNTADETEVRGTVEAPARVEKRKFNCFYKQKNIHSSRELILRTSPAVENKRVIQSELAFIPGYESVIKRIRLQTNLIY
jgi:hypothetical protein